MRTLVSLLLVFAGGALGALARVLLLAAPLSAMLPWPGGTAGESLELACINVVGSFLLGWLTSRIPTTTPRGRSVRLFLGTGALGGFTSYSSLILLTLPFGGAFPLGLILAVLSLLVGVAAAWLGLQLGRRSGIRDSEAEVHT
ncbi:MAG: fluoride efflux transporter FluC [Leucobacter sp.]